MANFDKIKINGVPYNVKDSATAQAVAQVKSDLAETQSTVQQQGEQIKQQATEIAQNKNDIAELFNSLAKAGQFVSIDSYGAKGDGTTDSATAIQNAIDENVGAVIFIPKGTYRISIPISVPNNTVIMGCGKSSLIKPDANIDCFVSQVSSGTQGNYLFCSFSNFAVNGGYYNSVSPDWVKSTRTVGSGFKLYGQCFKFSNVFVTNFPEYGVYATQAQTPSVTTDRNYFYEPTFDHCEISCCGKDGIYLDYVYDVSLSACSVNTNGQSDTSAGHSSGFANIHVEHSNIRMTNSHLSKLYGAVNPKYSLYLSQNSSNNNIANSHIEGAMIPCYVGADYNIFTNCLFYTAFGQCDVNLDAGHCIFSSCGFQAQASASTDPLPEWYGAFWFTGDTTCRNNQIINAMLNNCQLSTEKGLAHLGYVNDFIVNGWYGDGEQICAPLNLDKGFFQIHGDFGTQSSYEYMGGTTWYSAWGLPCAKTFYSTYVKQTDEETAASIINITGFTQGNLKLTGINPGQMKIIINNANVPIPWTLEPGVTINDKSTGSFPAKGIYIIVANDSTHWYGYVGNPTG